MRLQVSFKGEALQRRGDMARDERRGIPLATV